MEERSRDFGKNKNSEEEVEDSEDGHRDSSE
jgi:hypothetical protein